MGTASDRNAWYTGSARLDEANLQTKSAGLLGEHIRDEAHLVGNVEGVDVGCKADVCLLLAIGSVREVKRA